jgi:hypothetical protein
MTDINYLDGLPSTNVSTDGRSGEWKEFAPSHARTGWSFYFADPNWWDGVYPNAVRCVWGNQIENNPSWSICFWASDSTTHGVFLKLETRSDWRVGVNNDWAGATGSTALDGATRLRMGTISPSGESVAVERYFDTLPVCNDGLVEEDNGTNGFAVFAVSKTTSGYSASIYGPRLHNAFSFPCDDIFSNAPRLVTVSWKWSERPANAPFTVHPAKVGPDLGDFQIRGSGDSMAYDLRIYNQQKPHGPERATSGLPHVEMNATAPAPAIQRRQSEVGEAGTYASAGNTILSYMPASFNKTELVLTVTPTSALRNVTQSVLLPQHRIESLPPRTLRVAIDRGAPYALSGMRFFIPTQSVPSGSAGPSSYGPIYETPFINTELREAYPPVLVSPPAWGDLTPQLQLFFDNDPSQWDQVVSFWATRKSEYDSQLTDWNNPESTRTDFTWFTLSQPFQRNARTSTDATYISGNSAAALVHLSPRWRMRNVVDNSARDFVSHTSEGYRIGSPPNLVRMFTNGGERIVIRNKGPATVGETRRFWWETLRPYTFTSSFLFTKAFGLISARLTTTSGQDQFEQYTVRNKNQDWSTPAPFEKPFMRQTVSGSAPEDVVLSIQSVPNNVLVELFSNYSATYTAVAQASAFTSGLSYLGELDVEVSLAFE